MRYGIVGPFIIPQIMVNELNRINKTNEDTIRFELKSIALLCDDWAGSDLHGMENRFKKKMRHFQDAIITGQGSGSPEDVPFEFLADDYEVVKFAVDYLDNKCKQEKPNKAIASWLENVKIPFCFTGNKQTCNLMMPAPCPPDTLELLVKRLEGCKELIPSRLATEITGSRLPGGDREVKSETVRRACALRKKERARKSRPNLPLLSFEKRLLISVFFDLSSVAQTAKSLEWRAKILDAIMSDYPLIGIYYLVKISHELAGKTCIGKHDFKEVEKLYKFAYPKSKMGPFTKLLKQK